MVLMDWKESRVDSADASVVASWAKVVPMRTENGGWIRMKFRILCISGLRKKDMPRQRVVSLFSGGKPMTVDGSWREADF